MLLFQQQLKKKRDKGWHSNNRLGVCDFDGEHAYGASYVVPCNRDKHINDDLYKYVRLIPLILDFRDIS
jgi:hypothetical protein